jgi:cation diffusion facilitator family transporter
MTGTTAQAARPYTLLSIAAAIFTIGLKSGAYFVTGSVGLLSDALESGINLIAALVAFWALSFAAAPPDEQHPFGHHKAEYFSSGLESILILIAAIGIAITAGERLMTPQPLTKIDLGLILAVVAAAVNGVVAWILLRAGKRLRSITLRADAHHLLTDVWTSVGVLIAILIVKITGWLILDPLIAFFVAANIVVAGVRLLRETGAGLLDSALPSEDRRQILDILAAYEQREGIRFHALKTRISGSQGFINVHVLVPGNWTVQRGHDLCEEIESTIERTLPGSQIVTHLEPLEDPKSWNHLEIEE